MPSDQREVLALLAATGSAKEASVSGARIDRLLELAAAGCRALDAPGRERSVLERLRADAAEPLSLPDAEDEGSCGRPPPTATAAGEGT